jgi:hypothetical protein
MLTTKSNQNRQLFLNVARNSPARMDQNMITQNGNRTANAEPPCAASADIELSTTPTGCDAMTDTMTLEQVLFEARLVANNGCVSITRKNCAEWADAIDAAIKQREQGANNPLKGWIFDKLAEALRDATYVAGMLDAICETDGTVDHMQARDAAFRVRDALQAHTAE